MKTLDIQLVNSSQGCADSGSSSLPVIKFSYEAPRQASSEIRRQHPFHNESRVVIEGISVGVGRHFMLLLAVEVCL